MATNTMIDVRITGKGSKKIFDWARVADGDAGVFFAQVFGYDYENATEDDWDDWEDDFDCFRLGESYCSAEKKKDNSVLLHIGACRSIIPYGVFKKIAERFPSIHCDGRFIQDHEEFFGNIVIENGVFLWTQFDNPGIRSGEEYSLLYSFFEQEDDPDLSQMHKDVLELLKFDRDNMRALLADGKGFFRFHNEKKLKEYDYHSEFYFSEQELKAIAGDADSQYQIAQELLADEFFENNPKIYKKGYYSRELCSSRFEAMGKSWLEKAAMNGNPEAQYQLAKDYLYDDEAKDLFLFSLKNESKAASEDDQDVVEYDEEVLTEIGKLAKQGSVSAMKVLINYFEDWDSGNYLKWLKKASNCDDAESTYRLASHYLDSSHSRSNIDKGVSLLEKASELDFSLASFRLAQMYAYGYKVERNREKAIDFLQKCAISEIDNINANMQNELSSFLLLVSIAYLLACSENNLYSFSSDEIRELCFDRISDFYFYANCFSGEDEFATALGIEKDSEKYMNLLETAAEKGDDCSIFRLGKAYYEGEHIEKDFKKAFEYFLLCSKTANKEDWPYYLGLMYMNGEYVQKNLFMAERWLNSGSKKDSANSKELLKTVKKQIKAEQLISDKETISQMKAFEKAVLLVCQKKSDQAIVKLHELGDFLDSRQRIVDMIPLFRLKFDDLMSNHKFDKAQALLESLPRESDDLKILWEELNARLREAIKNKKFVVGEKGPAGGIIVYAKEVASDGWQYMEAATNAVSCRFWGKTEELGTETGIGSGKDNTYKIAAANQGKKTAAQYCLDYEQNGYKDWFLPSRDELSKLILPNYPKRSADEWESASRFEEKKRDYCKKHFGIEWISSSSESDELTLFSLHLYSMKIRKITKEVPLACIPFRVF